MYIIYKHHISSVYYYIHIYYTPPPCIFSFPSFPGLKSADFLVGFSEASPHRYRGLHCPGIFSYSLGSCGAILATRQPILSLFLLPLHLAFFTLLFYYQFKFISMGPEAYEFKPQRKQYLTAAGWSAWHLHGRDWRRVAGDALDALCWPPLDTWRLLCWSPPPYASPWQWKSVLR